MSPTSLMGTELLIYTNMYSCLRKVFDDERSDRFSYFGVQVYQKVAKHPVLQEELKLLYSTGKAATPALKQWYRSNGMMASETVQNGFRTVAKKAAIKEAVGFRSIGGFFDIVTGIAKACKIELNECTLAITKVSRAE